MDNVITQQILDWLKAKPENRSLEAGAELVLKLTGNVYMHRGIIIRKDFKLVEYQLKKYLPIRLQEVTHAQVQKMLKKAEQINQERGLDGLTKKSDPDKTEKQQSGRRADHSELPQEIQALYKENLDIMRQMQRVHLKIRELSIGEKPCKDCDLYPFVKELIDLDTQYHLNWKTYDEYGRDK